MNDLASIFQQKGFTPDNAQSAALQILENARHQWLNYQRTRIKKPSILRFFLKKPLPPKGIYLWGGVGRGKSFLMECFYTALSLKNKQRIHFHELMYQSHRLLDQFKGHQNPLKKVARVLASPDSVICLDEFHISDIADVLIFDQLLAALFQQRIQLVTTSNCAPDDLYPNGVHRDRLLPAIALIKHNMQLVRVDEGIDYRVHNSSAEMCCYYTPITADTEAMLCRLFKQLADQIPEDFTDLFIEHRLIKVKKRAAHIVWFDFWQLCGDLRSQEDYLALAADFKKVILSGVPVMAPTMANYARRFTWLIDIFYDHKIKLIISAEAMPEQLYQQGLFADEFLRTVSRLREMQSVLYWELFNE